MSLTEPNLSLHCMCWILSNLMLATNSDAIFSSNVRVFYTSIFHPFLSFAEHRFCNGDVYVAGSFDFFKLGFSSATYGETVHQLTLLSNPYKSVSIGPKFDLFIVNGLAALSNHAFDVIATVRNLHYKAEDKLELALDLIKCVGCQNIRCDS